jgi:hypothetical protein
MLPFGVELFLGYVPRWCGDIVLVPNGGELLSCDRPPSGATIRTAWRYVA